MDTQKAKRRRKEVFNKLEGGLECPPQICKGIIPGSGEFSFIVPSKSKADKSYSVNVTTESDGTILTRCTCQHGTEKYIHGKMYCSHINAAFVFFLSRFIKSTQKSYDMNSLHEEMNDLTDQLGSVLDFK